MKKRNLLLALASTLILAGCGSESGGQNTQGESQQTTVKYTVTFANTSMQSVQVEAGGKLSKPEDPTKANSLFVGWYLDANFQNEASFPLTINADTTLYANFYSYQEAFKKARANTIGDNVPGYEYDYTLKVSAGYMGFSLAGNTQGNSKYLAGAQDVSFYDAHTNSGTLFYDGSKYQIKKGRELHEISLDENENVKKYKIKDVGEDYKYDTSSFAKAIFEYSDDKLKSISPTNVKGEYLLKVSFNPSAAIALVGNYVNHPMVEKIIGELPETSVNTEMRVTFDGDKLQTYRYTMTIDVTGIQFNLTYALTFKNQGKAPIITPKVFNNTYVSDADVATMKSEIKGYFDTYKALAHSSYDFKVKTAVDFPKKNAINATIDGFAKRKVDNGNVYFLNDYEIDSDLKNADLYKAAGLGDCHGARAKLSTGEVHDLKKKAVLSGYTDVATVTDYQSSMDDYYLLDLMGMINSVSFVQKVSDSGKGTIDYFIGAADADVGSMLSKFNEAIRLNALGESSQDVKPYGAFAASSVLAKDFKFQITIANGTLSKISVKTNGSFETSYPGSRDFTANSAAAFTLNYTLEVTNDGASYEPAASVDKVK